MNSRFQREYFIIRTMSGDPIGLVSLVRPMSDASSYEFALQRPEHRDTDKEFLDLTFTSVDFPEYESHRDVFETHTELEVKEQFYSSTDMTNTLYIILRKPDEES